MQKITINDFESVKSLSEISHSPDGSKASFVMSQAHVKENNYTSNIYLLEGGKTRKLTSAGNERATVWLNNDTIVFPGDRAGKYKNDIGVKHTVFNKINVNGGEAEEFFAVPFAAKSPVFLDENTVLLLGTYDHNAISLEGLEGAEKDAAIAAIKEEKDYEVFDELPFWFNGRGVINKLRTRVYLCDIAANTQTALSPEFTDIVSIKYCKNCGKVAFFGNDYVDMDVHDSRVFLYDVNTKATQEIDLGTKLSVSAAEFAMSSLILAGTTSERFGSSENPIFFKVDLATLKISQFADLDSSVGSSVGSDCRHGGGKSVLGTKDGLYFTETIGFNSYIVKLSQDGTAAKVSPEINGSVDCFDKNGDKFTYVGMRENGLQEIYECAENGAETRLTSFNDEFIATHMVSKPEYLKFTDTDGVEIDGWVMKPAEYDSAKKYPAILNVHGGPKAVFGETFFHEMQFWASEGYFVFYCNPRGGDGKGNVFADIRGDNYGKTDYADIMEFTDIVLAKYPQIDAEKVTMAGGSYGGFMANWIVGHTNRFAAVASQRSISNYISKCLTTDIGYYHNLSAIQADPWTSQQKMWDHSPLKYADKATTPTLFIQSDEDYRCWMADAIQMFTGLRMHGVPVRMCLFHGENHELSRAGKPTHRIRRLREITNWFDKYAK